MRIRLDGDEHSVKELASVIENNYFGELQKLIEDAKLEAKFSELPNYSLRKKLFNLRKGLKRVSSKKPTLPNMVLAASLPLIMATAGCFGEVEEPTYEMPDSIRECNIANDSDRDCLTDEQERSIGTNPSKPDTDNDGLDDHYELINKPKTDPLKQTLLVEVDYYQSGYASDREYNPGEKDLAKYKSRVEAWKIVTPFLTAEDVEYLTKLFSENGIDLYLDASEGSNRGGQVLTRKYRIEPGCIIEGRNEDIERIDEDKCEVTYKNGTKAQGQTETYRFEDGTPWIHEDLLRDVYLNPAYFDHKERLGRFHYGVMATKFSSELMGEEELIDGISPLMPGDYFGFAFYEKPENRIGLFLHEIGHNFDLEHQRGTVMDDTAYGITNYTAQQWERIRSIGLSNSLKSTIDLWRDVWQKG